MALQRSYHMPTGYSTTSRHFLFVNGQMVAQSLTTPTMEPIIKMKGTIKLNPHTIPPFQLKHPQTKIQIMSVS